MKKLLSLLSVLTISGTAVPTTIAASPYQKEKNLNSDINYQQKNNLENLIRNKRDFYSKEQIELFNNDFFYKFNVKYYSGRKIASPFGGKNLRYYEDSKVIIEDWTKYANTWDQFESKFPEIEFINFRSELGGGGNTVVKDSFKMPTFLEKNNLWTKELKFDRDGVSFWTFRKDHGLNNNAGKSNWKEVNFYYHRSFVANQESFIYFRLYPEGKKLMIQHFIWISSANSFTEPWGKLKYDSIRLMGKIDVNPLFSLTFEKTKQFDIWANSKEAELQTKRKNKNYNQDILIKEEATFKEEFKLLLLQIRHDYIQDLINIDQNNDITGLKSEIDNIKSRLDELELKKTCLDNIFDSFKKNTLANAPGNAWQSIKENSESPLKIIIKKSGKAFAQGLLTGVAKGSALGIISCVAESIL